MSYIPPHKRDLKDPIRPSPFPDSLATKFKKNIDFKCSSAKSKVIKYSRDVISKWFLVTSNGIEDGVPPSTKLVSVSSDSSECSRYGETSLVLKKSNVKKVIQYFYCVSTMVVLAKRETLYLFSVVLICLYMIAEESEEEGRTRWMLLAEKVEKDLVLAYEQARKGMEDHHLLDNAKLRLVARFGKVVFCR